MMDTIQIVSTGDGSHSLLHTVLQETYHSMHGALTESRHVFIEHGLTAYRRQHPETSVRLLEVGFGTGLNALLSLLESTKAQSTMYYESWEKHPLPLETISQLNLGQLVGDAEAFEALHEASWDQPVIIRPGFTLLKRRGDIMMDPMTSSFDLIFYDAFAPSRQPEIWTLDILRKVTDTLLPGGMLVTYCAKGQVKRDLASLGLVVEALPGPPGKKEMTRATKPG